MRKFNTILVLVSLIILFIVYNGCDNKNDVKPVKLLSHVTNFVGDTTHFYEYSGTELVKAINTVPTSTNNEFIYKNGRIIKQIFHDSANTIYNYVYQGNTVIPIKEGDTVYRFKFYLNADNRVEKKIEYYNDMADSMISEYIYENGNAVKKILDGNTEYPSIYEYDNYPNPRYVVNDYYRGAFFSSINNVVKTNLFEITYKYDSDGYIIESTVDGNEFMGQIFYYK